MKKIKNKNKIKKYIYKLFFNFFCVINLEYNSMGIGDWGLGIGDWGLGPITKSQYTNTDRQSPIKKKKKKTKKKE